MSTDTPAVERLRRLRSLPYGPARAAATELITRETEEHGPREILPEALLSLVEAHTFSGGEDLAFAPFARVLRLWDEAPELFDEQDTHSLFWSFKWVADATRSYPQISRAQAEALLEDMERRYRLAGNSLASVEKIRLAWLLHTGEATREALQHWLTAAKDDSTDCAACDLSTRARTLLALGDLDEGARVARSQDGRCNREPAGTFHALAEIELLRGDAAAAREALRVARREVGRNDVDGCAAWRGTEFEVLARTGDLDLALRRFATSVSAGASGPALTGDEPLDTLGFLRGVCAGLSANPDRLEDPAPLLAGSEGPAGTLRELHEELRSRAAQLAGQFDRRNGTEHQSQLLADALAATAVGPAPAPAASTSGLEARSSAPIMDAARASGSEAEERGASASVSADDRRPPGAADDVPAGGTGEDADPVTSGAAPTSPDDRTSALGAADPQVLWEHAESLPIADPARAAAYLAAARAAESAGMLDDAGIAYAEHAQALVLAEQEAGAHLAFERAVRLLIAGDAPSGLIAQVITAWAPIAVLEGDLSAILEILQERLGQAEDPLERARLADSLARLIASAPDACAPLGLDRTDAMALAEQAADGFETAGSLDLAAHAGWLLARLQRDAGRAAGAAATYRIVLAAFGALRQQEHRAVVAGELIAHLRAQGETPAADEVARELGERLR